ncbi:hypothetical protein [Cupriavidus sp. TMH.W2]|uniref:hypothetical protein n=1 Tax=Cupriavidus sp. TMH.W2 TaxID=3434465 RepID=UPI003D770EC5
MITKGAVLIVAEDVYELTIIKVRMRKESQMTAGYQSEVPKARVNIKLDPHTGRARATVGS